MHDSTFQNNTAQLFGGNQAAETPAAIVLERDGIIYASG